ncbi:hypothetical protein BDY19DRAFT_543703 [Irpex rosettiformis]|uniref:Uncharacterized protein n=1 Tax=Irpex rosettiformis TaxID=378272 RepID=A0ACB8TQU0_9APHY|nr:hypothetical protein BDY19DRAFT_543703 [Irpex rosettiformis]
MRHSQCTDNALAGIMVLSDPRHEYSRRPHLSTTDSSSLLDVVRASRGSDASAGFGMRSVSGFDDIQWYSAARLTPDCDLAFIWWKNNISFYCIASRRPGDDSNIRYPTHIIMQTNLRNLTEFRKEIEVIDWGAFLRSAQKFPDLRGIVLQYRIYGYYRKWRKCLMELVPLLREAWAGVDAVLQIYRNIGDWRNAKWVRIPLSTVLGDVERTRELKEVAKRPLPINPESNIEAKPLTSNSHGDRIPVHPHSPMHRETPETASAIVKM